jgi:hypothetical protein
LDSAETRAVLGRLEAEGWLVRRDLGGWERTLGGPEPAPGEDDDPATGEEDDPTTGEEDDPATGAEDDPATGEEDDPATGA